MSEEKQQTTPPSAGDIKTATEKLQRARVQLVMREPFFGALLMQMPMQMDSGVKDMITNGQSIRFNPTYAANLPDPEILTLLAHCVLHPALGHIFRRGHRDAKTFNKAGDYAVNNFLDTYNKEAAAEGRPTPFVMPKGSTIDHSMDAMATEEIYTKLMARPKPPGGGGNGNGNSDDGDGSGNQPPGQFEDAQGDESEQTEQQEEWNCALRQAAMMAKAQGRMPASMQRYIETALKSPIDYKEELRDLVTASAADDYSWRKVNSRYAQTGCILPALKSEKMGHVAIVLDTSGSTVMLLEQFVAEVMEIVDTVKPEKITIIQCDAEVGSVDVLESGDTLAGIKATGGGGTSFKPPFEYLAKEQDEPVVLIYFTDLYGDFPAEEPPYPVIWAATTDQPIPWGRAVRVDAEELGRQAKLAKSK